ARLGYARHRRRREVADRQDARPELAVVAAHAEADDVILEDVDGRLVARRVGAAVLREEAVQEKSAEVEVWIGGRVGVLVVPDEMEGPVALGDRLDREVRVRLDHTVVAARDLDRSRGARCVEGAAAYAVYARAREAPVRRRIGADEVCV